MKKTDYSEQKIPLKGKKILSIGLAAMLTTSLLTACSTGSNAEDEVEITPPPATEAVATEAPATDAPVEEPAGETEETTIELSDTGIVITGEGADTYGNDITITGGGTYAVSGAVTDGAITVNAPGEDVTLTLNGANITNADGPAILFDDAASATLLLADGTENTLLNGGSTPATEEPAATTDDAVEPENAEPTEEAADADSAEAPGEPAEAETEETAESTPTAETEEAAEQPQETETAYGAALYGTIPFNISGYGALYINGSIAQGIIGEADIAIDNAMVIVTAASDGIYTNGSLAVQSGTVFAGGETVPALTEGSQSSITYAFDTAVPVGSFVSIREGNTEMFSVVAENELQTVLYSASLLADGDSYDIYVDNTLAGTVTLGEPAAGEDAAAASDATEEPGATEEDPDATEE